MDHCNLTQWLVSLWQSNEQASDHLMKDVHKAAAKQDASAWKAEQKPL